MLSLYRPTENINNSQLYQSTAYNIGKFHPGRIWNNEISSRWKKCC